MHFAARSALLASCLAISVQALPVTYSVVDVDGGSAANGASTSDQPATIYQTVTKSTEAEEPEATTVSVSITIVETKHASLTSTDVSSSSSSSPASSSTSSSSSSMKASAQASSSPPVPSATATSTQDASSVLQSAPSTFSTRPTSHSSSSASSTITQAPSAESASYASHSASSEECECEAPSVTVTADVTDAEETVTATKGETVVILSTTTVTPTASSTSYYDDGMWHTRYAVKPSAAPEATMPGSKKDDTAPTFDKSPKFNEKKQAGVTTNTTSQTANDTYHARREVDNIAATPTVPATPSGQVAEGSGAPLMLLQPLSPRATGIAARAVPTGGVASPSDVLSADVVSDTEQLGRRAPSYSVVSWNETLQG
jgi:hypothetical protein